jgi:hypothetical protein
MAVSARFAVIALACASGCFPTPSEKFACNITDDCDPGRICDRGYCVTTTTDGGDDAPAFDCKMFPARHFDACMIPQPGAKLVLDKPGVYTFNTDTGALTAPDSTMVSPPTFDAATGKGISVEGLAIGSAAALRVIGGKPLIVASWTTIDITGLVDVGSIATEKGAGAGTNTACAAALAGGNNGNGGGGSGGGGYAGAGGKGGNGGGAGGGNGGALIQMPLLAAGCPGAKGGGGNTVTSGGAAGDGGGAIQLTAQMSISIGGTITAAGAGGGAASRDDGAGGGDGGGGGGGSGGMIGLEAPSVAIHASAILAANGGGGGAGAQNNAGNPGQNGLSSATQASGGTAADAGSGGKGSGGLIMLGAGGGGVGNGGGGGGGGGAGYIAVLRVTPTVDTGAVTSPALTLAP